MFYHFSFVKNVTKLKCNSLVSKSLNGFFYRTLTLSRYGFQQKKMVYPDCLNVSFVGLIFKAQRSPIL